MATSTLLRGVDTLTIMRMLRLMVMPFEKWPAYETGVIDREGNTLKKGKQRVTTDEKNSFTLFHRLTRNIKRLIGHIPFGKTLLGSFASVLFLIRESQMNNTMSLLNEDAETTEQRLKEFMETEQEFIREMYEIYTEQSQQLSENVTTGAVQGHSQPMEWKPDRLMGMKVFDVDTNYYMKSRHGKKKHTKYARYVGEDTDGLAIREYANANPHDGIIVRDKRSGSMSILRRPPR